MTLLQTLIVLLLVGSVGYGFIESWRPFMFGLAGAVVPQLLAVVLMVGMHAVSANAVSYYRYSIRPMMMLLGALLAFSGFAYGYLTA